MHLHKERDKKKYDAARPETAIRKLLKACPQTLYLYALH